jgi:hypothetical protein
MNIGQQFNGEFFKPISGIYKITNIKNGRIYIGQSKSVQQRIATHFLELHQGRHIIDELQKDWNQYGAYSFLVELVEEVFNERFRLDREREILEQYAIDGIFCYNRDYYAPKVRHREWIHEISNEYLEEARDDYRFYQQYVDSLPESMRHIHVPGLLKNFKSAKENARRHERFTKR